MTSSTMPFAHLARVYELLIANLKAPRIQDALHTLTEQQQEQGGSKSLSEYLYDELAKRTSEEAWHYLRSISGVGPKTAVCVLLFDMDQPVMPIEMGNTRTAAHSCYGSGFDTSL